VGVNRILSNKTFTPQKIAVTSMADAKT